MIYFPSEAKKVNRVAINTEEGEGEEGEKNQKWSQVKRRHKSHRTPEMDRCLCDQICDD